MREVSSRSPRRSRLGFVSWKRPRRDRSAQHSPLAFELLEERCLLSVAAAEQLFVYELNRARDDPVAYQQEQNLSVDLSYVSPRGPLAVNDKLFASSRFHADEMATHNYIAHQSQVTGDWPNKMVRDQGYALPSHWGNDSNYVESAAAGYRTASEGLKGLIVDKGWDPPGHRDHLLGISDFSSLDREIGVGHAYSSSSHYKDYWAIHATRGPTADLFITGVVYDDSNGNRRYDLNEGLSGVDVRFGAVSTSTNEAGGWALKVSPGTYYVIASGSGFSGTAAATASVGDENVEVDFILGQDWGVVDFNDVEPPPALSIADVTLSEGNSGTKTFNFTVGMSGSNTQGAAVSFATANGTAAAGSDYLATNGTLTWAGGDTSAKTISVTVNGDRTVEPHETFYVNLTTPTNARLAKSQGVGTIQNDDVAPPGLWIGDVTLTEGNSGTKTFNFTVSMSGSNTQGAAVSYATANGTAGGGSDYLATNGTLTWAAGDTSGKTISVTVNGDRTVEPDERFYVNLTSPTNARLAKGQGVGTIQNDDLAPPALWIGDVTLTEGNSGTKTFNFTVSMSGSNTQGAAVSYATANGTAGARSDYLATNGTLTWAAGDTSAKTISVTVNGETTVEPHETFYVNLTSPTNATLAKSQGVGTIHNDDVAPPALWIGIGDVTLTEGNSGTKTFNFTVSMSGSNTQGAAVSYATANGTAGARSDYLATNGTLTWAAGDTSAKTISVTVNGDTTVEPHETFYVNLTSPTNATLAKSQGVGTIQNDDLAPRWQNAVNRLDVSGDGVLAPQDALHLANFLYFHGQLPVPDDPPTDAFPPEPPPHYDVNGDNFVSVGDALLVVAALRNQAAPEAEGERLLSDRSTPPSFFVKTTAAPLTVDHMPRTKDGALGDAVLVATSTITGNPAAEPTVLSRNRVALAALFFAETETPSARLGGIPGINNGEPAAASSNRAASVVDQIMSGASVANETGFIDGIELLDDGSRAATPAGDSDALDDFFAQLEDIEQSELFGELARVAVARDDG